MTYARIPKRKRTERAMELLECVGLEKRAGHMPNEMSGGQRQRVAIARALANEPPLILADEPTGNLDTAASIEIMEIFSELHKAGATVIVVTHEENIAAFTDRIIHFSDGQIIKDEINENPTKVSGKVHMKGLYRHFQKQPEQRVGWSDARRKYDHGLPCNHGEQDALIPDHAGHYHRNRFCHIHRLHRRYDARAVRGPL